MLTLPASLYGADIRKSFSLVQASAPFYRQSLPHHVVKRNLLSAKKTGDKQSLSSGFLKKALSNAGKSEPLL